MITVYDVAFALIGIGATWWTAYCLVISFLDINYLKDYKR
jgi:hypothetical protein